MTKAKQHSGSSGHAPRVTSGSMREGGAHVERMRPNKQDHSVPPPVPSKRTTPRVTTNRDQELIRKAKERRYLPDAIEITLDPTEPTPTQAAAFMRLMGAARTFVAHQSEHTFHQLLKAAAIAKVTNVY